MLLATIACICTPLPLLIFLNIHGIPSMLLGCGAAARAASLHFMQAKLDKCSCVRLCTSTCARKDQRCSELVLDSVKSDGGWGCHCVTLPEVCVALLQLVVHLIDENVHQLVLDMTERICYLGTCAKLMKKNTVKQHALVGRAASVDPQG